MPVDRRRRRPRTVRRRGTLASRACTCTGRCRTRCCAARHADAAPSSLPALPGPVGGAAHSCTPVGARHGAADGLGAGRPVRHGGPARRLHGHPRTRGRRPGAHAARRDVAAVHCCGPRTYQAPPEPVRVARPAGRPAGVAGRRRAGSTAGGGVHRRRLVERRRDRTRSPAPWARAAGVGPGRDRLVGLAGRARRRAGRADDPRTVRLRARWASTRPREDRPRTRSRQVRDAPSRAYRGRRARRRRRRAEREPRPSRHRADHYLSLLHGSVLGVPVDGTCDRSATSGRKPRPSRRPSGWTSTTSRPPSPHRVWAWDRTDGSSAERLLAAFTSGRLAELGQPDGLADLEEREHGDGFWSFAGAPAAGSHDDVLRTEDTAAVRPDPSGPQGPWRPSSGRLHRRDDPVHRRRTRIRGRAGGLKAARDARRTEGRRPRGADHGAWRDAAHAGRGQPPEGDDHRTDRAAEPHGRQARPAAVPSGPAAGRSDRRQAAPPPPRGRLVRERPSCAAGSPARRCAATRVSSPDARSCPRSATAQCPTRSCSSSARPRSSTATTAAGWPTRPRPTAVRSRSLQTRIAAEQVRLYGTEGRYDGTGPGCPARDHRRYRAAPARPAGPRRGLGDQVDGRPSVAADLARALAGERHAAEPGGGDDVAPAVGAAVAGVARYAWTGTTDRGRLDGWSGTGSGRRTRPASPRRATRYGALAGRSP